MDLIRVTELQTINASEVYQFAGANITVPCV